MSDDSTEHAPSVGLEGADCDAIAAAATDPAPPAAARPVNKLRLILLLATVIIVADQLTKAWAVASLANEPPTHVIWTLQWNLSFNSGMAFSQAQGIGPVIGVVATLVIVGLALSLRKIDHPLALVAAGLIIGGALGNLGDRMFRGRGWMHGAVVDFIDFQWFPIFNIADVAVNVGAALLILGSILSARSHRLGEANEPTSDQIENAGGAG
jgi:signal peptidase II